MDASRSSGPRDSASWAVISSDDSMWRSGTTTSQPAKLALNECATRQPDPAQIFSRSVSTPCWVWTQEKQASTIFEVFHTGFLIKARRTQPSTSPFVTWPDATECGHPADAALVRGTTALGARGGVRSLRGLHLRPPVVAQLS